MALWFYFATISTVIYRINVKISLKTSGKPLPASTMMKLGLLMEQIMHLITIVLPVLL